MIPILIGLLVVLLSGYAVYKYNESKNEDKKVSIPSSTPDNTIVYDPITKYYIVRELISEERKDGSGNITKVYFPRHNLFNNNNQQISPYGVYVKAYKDEKPFKIYYERGGEVGDLIINYEGTNINFNDIKDRLIVDLDKMDKKFSTNMGTYYM